MTTAVAAAQDFVSGPRVVQAASRFLKLCPLPQLCEALAGAKGEEAEPLVAALEGLSEIHEVRSLFLEEGVANFLKQGASAPEPRLRLTVSKLLAHLSGNEETVQQLLDAGLYGLCEGLLLDEETGVAETAAKAVCAAVGYHAGQQALVASAGSLTDVLQGRLADLPDVQRIRVLALFVQLGRVKEVFPLLEQKGAFEKVLGSFLTDDLLLKLNAVELMDALGSYELGQEFLAKSSVPERLEADLLDPYCDGSVRLCVTRLLGFIAGRSARAADHLLRSHEAPFPQSVAGLLDSRDVACRLCAIHAWATSSLQTKGLSFFLKWRPLLEEMVSLIACTQNEIAKGIMDAWATILQAWAPEDQDAAQLWGMVESLTQPVLKNLTNKPFPDVRPHTWQLLSVLCRSRKAAQLALQSPELQQLLLNFQSEASTDARYAKHALVKTLVDTHTQWIGGLLDPQVMDFMTQFAEQGPYWVPKSAGTAMKDEAA